MRDTGRKNSACGLHRFWRYVGRRPRYQKQLGQAADLLRVTHAHAVAQLFVRVRQAGGHVALRGTARLALNSRLEVLDDISAVIRAGCRHERDDRMLGGLLREMLDGATFLDYLDGCAAAFLRGTGPPASATEWKQQLGRLCDRIRRDTLLCAMPIAPECVGAAIRSVRRSAHIRTLVIVGSAVTCMILLGHFVLGGAGRHVVGWARSALSSATDSGYEAAENKPRPSSIYSPAAAQSANVITALDDSPVAAQPVIPPQGLLPPIPTAPLQELEDGRKNNAESVSEPPKDVSSQIPASQRMNAALPPEAPAQVAETVESVQTGQRMTSATRSPEPAETASRATTSQKATPERRAPPHPEDSKPPAPASASRPDRPPPRTPVTPEFRAAWVPAEGAEPARIRLERDGRRVEIVVVAIPAGSFEMGSEAALDESPVRAISVAPFFLGRYETTVTQMAFVLGDDRTQRPAVSEGEDGEIFPATEVDWHTAHEFCDRINLSLGEQVREVRLPWEFEWEYAAKKALAVHDKVDSKLAHEKPAHQVLLREAWIDEDPVDAMPRPVGRKEPNTLGIYDLFGNVEEWMQDAYERSAYQRSDPRGRVDGAYGSLRGGSCITPAAEIRVSRRHEAKRTLKDKFVGFRIVVVP